MVVQINLLEPNDTILATDYARQLHLQYDGSSDIIQTIACYSGARINRMGWMTAKEVCPYWVGKSVGEFNAAMKNISGRSGEEYEFVRGDLPPDHIE